MTVLRVIPITVWVSRMLPLWCVVISSHKCCTAFPLWASLVAQRLKHLPAMRETWVRSLDREDPLEKEMATHSSILAWRIPWTEKPGRLQSTGSQRVGYNWVTSPSPSPCVPKDKNHSFGYSFTHKNHFVSWSISLGQWRHQCMTLQDIWLGLFKTKGSTGKWQSTKNVPGSHTHNTEHQQIRCFWAERNCGESLQLGEKVGTLRHLITLAGPEFQFCLPVAWSLRKFQFFDPMFPSIWNAVLQ